MLKSSCKITQSIVFKARKDWVASIILKDTEVRGLQLYIGQHALTWSLEYKPAGRREDGKQHSSKSHKFGTYNTHSIAEARKAAARLKLEIAGGVDPAIDKKAKLAAKVLADKRATTMQSEYDLYINGGISGSIGHVRTEQGALRLGIEEMTVSTSEPNVVTTADVRKMLDLHKGRASGIHRYGAMNRFFDHLMDKGVVETNPCHSISKRAKPKPPAPRSRFYSASEVQALWNCISKLTAVRGAFLRAMILCPLRAGAMGKLSVSDIDLEGRRIVVPEVLTKNGDAFSMPLSDAAYELFCERSEPLSSSDRMFQLSGAGTEMTSWSFLTKKVREASGVADFNFHDLRRTFLTEIAELGIGDVNVADALLNHRQSTTRGGVIGAYNHATLWPQKKLTMSAWAMAVEHAVISGKWRDESTKVVSIGMARE